LPGNYKVYKKNTKCLQFLFSKGTEGCTGYSYSGIIVLRLFLIIENTAPDKTVSSPTKDSS